MKPNLLGALVMALGLASVIVLPYVMVDFTNTPGHKFSASEWASWAQAIGTILAVAVAAWVALYQQDKNRCAQEEQRERKSFAARAVLPASLSELMEYINGCLDALIEYRNNMDDNGIHAKFEAPPTPVSLINSTRDCIEFADEGPRNSLASLVERLQIQAARLSLIGKSGPRINMITPMYTINSNIVDTLDLFARVELLFPYARRLNNADPGQPTFEHLRVAASMSHFADDQDVMKIIRTRYH